MFLEPRYACVILSCQFRTFRVLRFLFSRFWHQKWHFKHSNEWFWLFKHLKEDIECQALLDASSTFWALECGSKLQYYIQWPRPDPWNCDNFSHLPFQVPYYALVSSIFLDPCSFLRCFCSNLTFYYCS